MPLNQLVTAKTVMMTRTPSTHPKNLPRNTFLLSKAVPCHSRTLKCTPGTCHNQLSSNSKLLHIKITLLNNKEVAATQCHLRPASPNNTRIKHRSSLLRRIPVYERGPS